MVKTAFVGLAALAAGAFLGLLVWEEREAAPAPAAERAAPPPSKTAARSPVIEKATEPLRAQIESLCAAAPRAESGVITGMVVTEGGQPLANVRIDAEPWRETRAGRERPAAADDPASQVLARVEAARDTRAWRREARTDARGRFAIEGLDDRTYELRASAPGYECVRANEEGLEPAARMVPGGEVTFIAVECREIAIVLRFPDGTPPHEGRVACRPLGTRSYGRESELRRDAKWVPPRGAVSLACGEWLVEGRAERDGVAYAGKRKVLVPGLAPVARVEIELSPRLSIKGRVMVSDTEDEQPYVALERHCGSTNAEVWLNLGGQLKCGRDRSFEFDDLDAGTYRVSAARSLYPAAEVSAIVELSDRPALIELELPPPEAGDDVVLRVVDPRGMPLLGSETRVAWDGGSVQRGEGGSWRLRYGPDVHSEDDEYSITVSAEGYGSKSVWWKRRETRELVVQFEEPAMVRVALDASPGQRGMSHLEVGLMTSDLSTAGFESGTDAAAEGDERELLLGPLPPGDYDIFVTAYVDAREGGGGTDRTISDRHVQLRSGMNVIPFALPELHRLAVRVDPGLECGRLYLWSLDVEPAMRDTKDPDENGTAAFQVLLPGNYRLTAPGLRVPGDMAVRIPGPAAVRFEPRTMNALRVRSLDALSDEAPFLVGDTIVGIDGKRLTDMNMLLGLLEALAGSAVPVKANVIRGNEEMEIEVAPSVLSKAYMRSLWPLSF